MYNSKVGLEKLGHSECRVPRKSRVPRWVRVPKVQQPCLRWTL